MRIYCRGDTEDREHLIANMSSDDLDAIRARRMQEMQQQRAQQGGKVMTIK